MADPSEFDDDDTKATIKLEKGEGLDIKKEMDSPRKSSRLLNSKPNNVLESLKKRKRSDPGSDVEKDKPYKRTSRTPKSPVKHRAKKTDKRTPKRIAIKQEKTSDDDDFDDYDDEDEDEDNDEAANPSEFDDKFDPAILGLHRVGDDFPKKENKEQVQLNRRGMPQRIRKKNPLFYDENVVNHLMPKQRNKEAKKEKQGFGKKYKVKFEKREEIDVKPVLPMTDKKVGQRIGLRLRNLLKLPKAHKWVCYEWFYSNIDRVLFLGKNDFLVCLRESFRQLKTTMMTRSEWGMVRRMMGKPRRCSQAFFEEERHELDRRRNVIRQLQQRKLTDLHSCKDLPDKVPMQLTIGQKVTARLRKPQDGLFTGVIDAVDTSNNTYRITFERQGLGTHSVPDFEVLSDEEPSMFQLSAFPKRLSHQVKQLSRIDQIKTGDISRPGSPSATSRNDHQFSFLINNVVRLSKILAEKQSLVEKQRQMNVEAEETLSNGEEYKLRFQRDYASLIISLDKVNSSLESFFTKIQKMCHLLAPEQSRAVLLTPAYLRDESHEQAVQLIDKYFQQPDKSRTAIKNEKLIELITSLVALIIQVKSLSDTDKNAHELNVLKQSMAQIKAQISVKNQVVFRNRVEVHMELLESGLGPFGALVPFAKQMSHLA